MLELADFVELHLTSNCCKTSCWTDDRWTAVVAEWWASTECQTAAAAWHYSHHLTPHTKLLLTKCLIMIDYDSVQSFLLWSHPSHHQIIKCFVYFISAGNFWNVKLCSLWGYRTHAKPGWSQVNICLCHWGDIYITHSLALIPRHLIHTNTDWDTATATNVYNILYFEIVSPDILEGSRFIFEVEA